MPTSAEDKPWYSFDFGPIHFLQYSGEHVFAKGVFAFSVSIKLQMHCPICNCMVWVVATLV